MNSALIFGLVMAGVVGVPALGMLGMWCHYRRQETRCRRGLHEWGRWLVNTREISTVLGLRDVMVSCCQRGCGARVRRLTEAGDSEGYATELAERLFRETRS